LYPSLRPAALGQSAASTKANGMSATTDPNVSDRNTLGSPSSSTFSSTADATPSAPPDALKDASCLIVEDIDMFLYDMRTAFLQLDSFR